MKHFRKKICALGKIWLNGSYSPSLWLNYWNSDWLDLIVTFIAKQKSSFPNAWTHFHCSHSHISQAFSRRLTQLAKRHLVWRSWHPASLIKRQTPFTWFNTALIWWWKTTQLLCKDVLFKELRDLEILKQTSFKDVGVSTLIIQRYIVCEWGKL